MLVNLRAMLAVIALAAIPNSVGAGGVIGDLIDAACGNCGLGKALDKFHQERLGNVLDFPADVLREGVVEVAGPALAEAIRHSRDDARRAGTKPMPPDMLEKLSAFYPRSMLEKIQYRVGQGGELSVQANSFRFGDAVAVALIDTVIFRSSYDALYNDILWAHEIKHIEQYEKWGLTDFGKRYVRSARRVEEEAINAANEYAKINSPGDIPPIWYRLIGGLKHIDAQRIGVAWGVNRNDQIWRWNGKAWTAVRGGLKQISVANDGAVWGVNSNDQIWRWNGNGWDKIPGGLKQISVGSSRHIWGVNSNDQIWRWNGNGWDKISGGLKQISVANDGSVWGVNRNDQIWRWNGNDWDQIPGGLRQISVGSSGNVWGVNSNDQIWRWNGNDWDQIPGGLRQISVASDGSVWGVNRNGQIYLHR